MWILLIWFGLKFRGWYSTSTGNHFLYCPLWQHSSSHALSKVSGFGKRGSWWRGRIFLFWQTLTILCFLQLTALCVSIFFLKFFQYAYKWNDRFPCLTLALPCHSFARSVKPMVIWFVLKKECLGQQAESLVEGLLQHGRLTLEQMIQREAARAVKGYSLKRCDKNYHCWLL